MSVKVLLRSEKPYWNTPHPGHTLVGKPLYLYIATIDQLIGVVLVHDNQGEQLLVYFVSKALHNVVLKYKPCEKAYIALLTTTRN